MNVNPNVQKRQVTTDFVYAQSTVRTILIENNPWFVGKDICQSLGIKSHRDSLSNLDDDERRESEIPTPSGIQKMVVINESGLYHLIFRSNKEQAKTFRKWVTAEVLPQIRKTGSYTKSELGNIQQHEINGQSCYLYTELLEAIGYSTRSGHVYERRRKYPQYFLKAFDRVFVLTDFATYLQQRARHYQQLNRLHSQLQLQGGVL